MNVLIVTVLMFAAGVTSVAVESDSISHEALSVAPLAQEVPAKSAIDHGKALFQAYVELESAFDAKIAALYSDEAYIENTRVYPWGETRKLTLPAPKYKELLRQTMSLAESRGDRITYSDVTYVLESGGVRITALRYSALKDDTTPLSILVKPVPGAQQWLIYEELSQSKP